MNDILTKKIIRRIQNGVHHTDRSKRGGGVQSEAYLYTFINMASDDFFITIKRCESSKDYRGLGDYEYELESIKHNDKKLKFNGELDDDKINEAIKAVFEKYELSKRNKAQAKRDAYIAENNLLISKL